MRGTSQEGEPRTRSRQELLPHEKLSPREFQVFPLRAEGKALEDLAAELDLTPGTVSTCVAHARETLPGETLAEVLRYAFRAGHAGD